MNKSIFDLDNKELNKVAKEFRKTSYGFNYFLVTLGAFIITAFLIIDYFIFESNEYSVFVCIFLLFIIELRRLNMIKKYYDEKYNKKQRNNIE